MMKLVEQLKEERELLRSTTSVSKRHKELFYFKIKSHYQMKSNLSYLVKKFFPKFM